MSTQYRSFHVDVFTSKPFSGNQLGVLFDAQDLSSQAMQTIARELNLPETTFVLPANQGQAAKLFRTFTPFKELPVAGHPTIGTALLLARCGEVSLDGELTDVVIETGVGPITLKIEGHNDMARFAWMSQPAASLGAIRTSREQVAQALDLTVEEISEELPVQVASTGVPFLIVPLRSLNSIQRCRPSAELLNKVLGECEGVYVFTHETGNPEAQFRARMFSSSPQGVYEDPATGSAAAALAVYLYEHNRLPHQPPARFLCEQGIEMGRESQIHIKVRTENGSPPAIEIGGEMVIISEGRLSYNGQF